MVTLFWRIFLLNAAVLITAILVLAFGPATVSTPVVLTEIAVLGVGLVVMLGANAVLLRIALDRLEIERVTSTAHALQAQEAERHRIAQELHDEVGQTMTAVLLELKRLRDQVPEPLQADVSRVQETTRTSLDEIRRIAKRLRPGVLEELGLISALKSLATETASHSGLTVRRAFDPDLPAFGSAVELVLFRVAQEGLTNVARHARAQNVELALRRHGEGIRLAIVDNGRGLRGAPEGAGIRGMRERALLVGADLTVSSDSTGTSVCLDIPKGPR